MLGCPWLSSELKKSTVVDESLSVLINPMFCYENTFNYSREIYERFNLWEQTLWQKCTYWQNKKFDHTKIWHKTVCIWPKVLGKVIGLPDKQVLENVKESFPPKIEAQLIDIEENM